MVQNSKFYSGLSPRRITNLELPHVTIQCPVYKEGLYSVIDPTIISLKAAISTYEMQGGRANIFINDDGMQLISPEDPEERRNYYEEQRVGWVARPKHNAKPADGGGGFYSGCEIQKGFQYESPTGGQFQSRRKPCHIERGEKRNQEAGLEAYNRCLDEVKVKDNGRTWAEGNGPISDYILLVDSDTRVFRTAFLMLLVRWKIRLRFLFTIRIRCYERYRQLFRKRNHFFHKPRLYSYSVRCCTGRCGPFCGP